MVQSLLLLSWYEQSTGTADSKSGILLIPWIVHPINVCMLSLTDARAYSERALEMASALHLGDETMIHIYTNAEDERERLRILWNVVRPYDWFDVQPGAQV
jgi:hypothetical protein